MWVGGAGLSGEMRSVLDGVLEVDGRDEKIIRAAVDGVDVGRLKKHVVVLSGIGSRLLVPRWELDVIDDETYDKDGAGEEG